MELIMINFVAVGVCAACAVWAGIEKWWKMFIIDVAFVLINVACIIAHYN